VQSPGPPNTPDDPLYEAFYGLHEQPFAISTDPKFLFLSASHQRAYQELFTGLQRHEGLLLLTGEAGTGKTTLCRAVIDALGERTFSAILLNPYMSGAELLKIVLKEFGLVTREELRRGALARAEPPQLLDAIEGFLLSVRSIDSRAVIVVDEAQSLSPAVLDQVRLLTALERQGKPLLQIIICGQPRLIDTLKKDVLYALSERVTRRVHLAPLLADEIPAYIQHRLSVAGGGESVEFMPEATTLIAELSRGLPRRVNLLCDRSLQEGRVEGARKIPAEIVRRAARSLAGAQPRVEPPTDSIADGVPDFDPPPVAEPATPPVPPPAAAAAPPPAANRSAPDADVTAPGEIDQSPEAAADALIRRFQQEAAASRREIAHEAPAVEAPSIMFGQGEPERRRRKGWLFLVFVAAVLAAGLGYGYYATTALSIDVGIPAAPEAPPLELPPVPAAIPVPDEATLAQDLEQFHLLLLLTAGGGAPPGAGS
jgi:general secretion pathway protein A